MKTSQTGIKLIQEFEGLRLKAYQCSARVWTIGWGHTKTVRPGMEITRDEAEALLEEDLVKFERGVYRLLTREPSQNQFDAMVSLAFNIGLGAFSRSSVLRHFNTNNDKAAEKSFHLWRKGGGKVLPGLVRRRAAEAELYAS